MLAYTLQSRNETTTLVVWYKPYIIVMQLSYAIANLQKKKKNSMTWTCYNHYNFADLDMSHLGHGSDYPIFVLFFLHD